MATGMNTRLPGRVPKMIINLREKSNAYIYINININIKRKFIMHKYKKDKTTNKVG